MNMYIYNHNHICKKGLSQWTIRRWYAGAAHQCAWLRVCISTRRWRRVVRINLALLLARNDYTYTDVEFSRTSRRWVDRTGLPSDRTLVAELFWVARPDSLWVRLCSLRLFLVRRMIRDIESCCAVQGNRLLPTGVEACFIILVTYKSAASSLRNSLGEIHF